MNGGCSPSSGRYLAQGTVAEAGGWVDMRSRSWTETLGRGGEDTGFPRRTTGAADEMQKEWRRCSCRLLQKRRNRRRCSRTKTHGSWKRSFNVSRTR